MGDRRKSLIPISDAHHDKGRASRLLTGNWDKKLFIYILFFTYLQQSIQLSKCIQSFQNCQWIISEQVIASIQFEWTLTNCNRTKLWLWTLNIYKTLRHFWGLFIFGKLYTKKVPCWEYSVCIRFFLQTNWIFLFPHDQVKTFYIFNLTS